MASMRVRAATESVADMVALYFTINPVYKWTIFLSYLKGIIQSNWLIKYVKPKMTPNDTIVPKNPKINIYLKFLPKFCFLRLYPPAKIMGGSKPKKNNS